MKVGSKVKVLEEFDQGIVTHEKGDILTVSYYVHKQKLLLKADGVADLIRIEFNDIDKYVESVIEYTDPLAELEAVALEHYVAKGYKLPEKQNEKDKPWYFTVLIGTGYKSKQLDVKMYVGGVQIEGDSYAGDNCETTKEMFDKAIEHFRGVK